MTDSLLPSSKADTTNPKDLVGNTKVSITKLPAVAIVHGAHAMMDGARKYNSYNWRSKKVVAHIYIDAAMRHLMAWFEGEELASDSKVHHLGHAIACCAILLDAQETGNLVDDRPVDDTNRAVLSRVLDRLKKQIESGVARPDRELKAPPMSAHEICTHHRNACGECNEKAQHHVMCSCDKCSPVKLHSPPESSCKKAPHHATCACDECPPPPPPAGPPNQVFIEGARPKPPHHATSVKLHLPSESSCINCTCDFCLAVRAGLVAHSKG